MHIPELSDLEELARQAGEIVKAGFSPRPGYGPDLQVEYKGLINPVTEVDQRTEAFLLSEIQRRFPGQRLVAEESGEKSGSDCCEWFIDPIDGTVNYAHGVPICAISLGFAYQGTLQLGVIYNPIMDELFSAARGQGATLNGLPIHVSKNDNLDQSLLVTGFSYDIRTHPENNLDHFVRLSLRSQGVRRLGSAAMDLAYVAAGRFEGYWELRLSPWDVAAGGLIAQEAGAIVTNFTGELIYWLPPCSIVAANPAIHAVLLKELHPPG